MLPILTVNFFFLILIYKGDVLSRHQRANFKTSIIVKEIIYTETSTYTCTQLHKHGNSKRQIFICDVIKQNQSERGGDMILASDSESMMNQINNIAIE